MPGFTLRDEGLSYKKICQKGRWVGRVVKCSDGRFLGIIKPHSVYADSEEQAFAEVAAKALGYPSAAALRARNAQVAAKNRSMKAHACYAVQEFYNGNSKPLIDML